MNIECYQSEGIAKCRMLQISGAVPALLHPPPHLLQPGVEVCPPRPLPPPPPRVGRQLGVERLAAEDQVLQHRGRGAMPVQPANTSVTATAGEY